MAKSPDGTRMPAQLLEFVEENNGSLSATRLAFLIWSLGVLVVWCINSLKGGSPAPLDGSVVTILGVLMTGKVIQKFGENSGDDQDGSKTDGSASQTPDVAGEGNKK